MKTLRKITEAELKNLELFAIEQGVRVESLIGFHVAMLAGRVYILKTPSKSGMSCKLDVYYIRKNQLVRAVAAVYNLMGCNHKQVIHGGGMDMAFQALYSYQFQTLTPRQMLKYSDIPSYHSM